MSTITRREFIVTATAGAAAAISGAGATACGPATAPSRCVVFVAGLGLYVRDGDKQLDVLMPRPPRGGGVPHRAALLVSRQSVDHRQTSAELLFDGDLALLDLSDVDLSVVAPSGAGRLDFRTGDDPIDQCPATDSRFDYRHVIDLAKVAPGVQVDIASARKKAICSVAVEHGRVDVVQDRPWRWTWQHPDLPHHAQIVSPGLEWTSAPAEAHRFRVSKRGTVEERYVVLVPHRGETEVVCFVQYFPRAAHADHRQKADRTPESHLSYLADLLTGVSPDRLSPTAYTPCGPSAAPQAPFALDQFRWSSEQSARANIAGLVDRLCGVWPTCVPGSITAP